MKKEKILIIVITILTTAIISTIVLVPMISRLMGETREPSSKSLEEAKKDGNFIPSFAMNKKTKEETKEKTSEEEKKKTEKIEEPLETEESSEEIIETSSVPTTESAIETVAETTPIPETISSSSATTSPSETKSQVFLGEDMAIINSGFERNSQMTAIKDEIKNLMTSEIPQEVAQRVYDLASEGQSLVIANIDTFSYIIGADAEGKFSYMDDEARVLNITCFKQDIEIYRNDYSEFQTYIDWANLFITK